MDQEAVAQLPGDAGSSLPADRAAPLHLVARPPGARAEQPSESTRRRWARMGMAVDAAREAGRADGLRDGYLQGWRWGVGYGFVAGAVVTWLAWSVYRIVVGGLPT